MKGASQINDIQEEGFSILHHFFDSKEIDEMTAELNKHHALQYDEQIVADFNLIKSIPFIKTLAESHRLISIVKQVLGENSFPANAFIIDKTKTNNWTLDWHQDLRIAVSNEKATTGYSDRTVERNITHAIAPLEVLEKRLSVRIHLDNCHIDNGAMLVVPKSHKVGIIETDQEIKKMIAENIIYCEVEKGGIMLLKSLLLHKSPYSITDKKRRVLNIDYVGIQLTNSPEWYNVGRQ